MAENSHPAKKHVGAVNQFAKETGVAGIHMLRREISTFEQAFWLIVALFLAGLTGRDLYTLTERYLDEKMITTVSIQTNDSIFFDPPPTIRLSLFPQYLTGAIEPKNITHKQLVAMLDEFELVPRDVNDAWAQNATEDEKIRTLVRLNVLLFDGYQQQEKTAASNFSAPTTWPSKQRIAHLQTMFDFYRAKNMSLIDVKKATCIYLCKELRVRVTTPDGRTADICTKDHVLELFGDGLSLITSTASVRFANWQQQFIVEFEHKPFRYGWLRLAGGYTVLANKHDDAPVIYDSQQRSPIVFPPLTLVVHVRPMAVFDRVETAKHPCMHETHFDCSTDCAVKKFLECLNCWPVQYSAQPTIDHFQLNDQALPPSCPTKQIGPNASVFDLGPFTNVAPECRTHSSFDECAAMCKTIPECETRTFAHSVEQAQIRKNSTRSAIRVVVQSFSFPTFTENLEMTWDSYLAQLGGSLGLYLGLSFAVLLHVPMFFVRQFCKLVQRCRKKRILSGIEDDETRRIRALERAVEYILAGEKNQWHSGEIADSDDDHPKVNDDYSLFSQLQPFGHPRYKYFE